MPHVIIGDEAFPLKRYLMRPYPAPQIHVEMNKNFNDRLSRARKIVENAFGILVQKFRLYNRKIQLNPENVDKVIMTTCILHNFIKSSGGGDQLLDETDSSCNNLRNLPGQGGRGQNEVFDIRDKFAMFFNLPEGTM